MKTTNRTGLFVILSLLSLGTALASDGAIPIWEPTTITEPGTYVVTRNITVDGSAIVVVSDGVDIDLNGFTLDVRPMGIGLNADNVRGLSVYNGRIVSDDNASIFLTGVTDFAIRNIHCTHRDDAAIWIGDSANGVIEDNRITDSQDGMTIYDGTNITIRRNAVHGGQPPGGIGGSCDGCLIESNVVDGLGISGSGSLVLDNVTRRLTVWGDNNYIEGNASTGSPTYGLTIMGSGNVYRNNTVRANNGTACAGTSSGGDFCDEGTGNSSGGGNFMPDEM